MGKYTRKPKPSGDVAPSSSLGVRTRAKTLALNRLQSSSQHQQDYLELRSRRLEKPPLLWQYLQNSRKAATAWKRDFACGDGKSPRIESSGGKERLKSKSLGCNNGYGWGDAKEEGERCLEVGDLEIEASLGENNLDVEVMGRTTRESTPCSLIRSTDNITPPGSSTKQRSPAANHRVHNLCRNVPTAQEIEEFFSRAEQLQHNRFIEKYNFDIVNDLPLPGRYEWIRVTP